MKSRHQREVSELKEQVHRANLASERDQALREKVFNEAKAEVMALSKKVYRIILTFCFVSSVSFSFFYVRSILFGVALRITITMVVQLWWRKLNIVNPVLWGNCCFLIFLLSFSFSRFLLSFSSCTLIRGQMEKLHGPFHEHWSVPGTIGSLLFSTARREDPTTERT